MKLTVLGSSAGAPGRTNPASGYLVEESGFTLWLDAGTGTFMEMARLTDPGALDAVIISHLHVDHMADLIGLYAYLAHGPGGDVPITVHAPPGAAKVAARFIGMPDEEPLARTLAFVEAAAGASVEIGPFTVRFGEAAHSIPARVVRVEAGSSAMTYSGDTGPGGDLIELATGADLLLCEATMTGVRDRSTYEHHMTASDAAEVAAWAAVDRLVLTHISHSVDPQRSIDEASAHWSGPVDYAAPGSVFEF